MVSNSVIIRALTQAATCGVTDALIEIANRLKRNFEEEDIFEVTTERSDRMSQEMKAEADRIFAEYLSEIPVSFHNRLKTLKSYYQAACVRKTYEGLCAINPNDYRGDLEKAVEAEQHALANYLLAVVISQCTE
ncbi:hypothetical protein MK805_13825 [Shimazuella sp. AN120528]|uniref:hypothetical protein n=1 Tax=Shimazuella soli TaxID=1892854 RepID=UPI001F0ED573|nr:hypothetical protein [Shimazuella soli]MCH5586018.1 hypothetical protein [Shimazuella soli]